MLGARTASVCDGGLARLNARASAGFSRGTILAAAIASRALAMAFAVISDSLLPDHEPEGVLVARFPPECSSAQTFSAFLRWDAAHFLGAASDGWQSVHSHAFFPLYPLLVRCLACCLPAPFCAAELRVLAGLLLSNGAFVVAACCLHALGERVVRDSQLAGTAALLFCAAPASVFFSALYAESIFSAATFGGLILLERGAPWGATAILALASGCRANGVLNVLPLACAGARQLAGSLSVRRVGDVRLVRDAAVAARALACVAAQVAIVSAPYICWQLTGLRRVSVDGRGQNSRVSSMPPPTRLGAAGCCSLPGAQCGDQGPDLYAHVQRTYWGVGLFRYYTCLQAPNFAVAVPALALCACGSVATLLLLRARYAHLRDLRNPIAVARGGYDDRRGAGRGAAMTDDAIPARASSSDGAMTPRALPFVLQWVALSVLSMLFANVQTTTRLVSAACPAMYWYSAHLLLLRGCAAGKGAEATAGGGGWLASRRLRTGMLVYTGGFAVAGTVLHSNNFPWL